MSRRAWIVFGLCTALLLAGLGWISLQVLGLDASRRAAEAEAARLGSLRLALWRMDSWLVPRLAREAARPYFEYQSYVPTDRVYDEMLQPVDTESPLLRASPLLTPVSDVFPLHFQLSDDGALTSPQVPYGAQLDLAYATCTTEGVVRDHLGLLERLRGGVDFSALEAAVGRSEALGEGLANNVAIELVGPVLNADRDARGKGGATPEPVQTLQAAAEPDDAADLEQLNAFANRVELQKRAQTTKYARAADNWAAPQVAEQDELPWALDPDAESVTVGELVPVWTDRPVVRAARGLRGSLPLTGAAPSDQGARVADGPGAAEPPDAARDAVDLLFVRRVDVNGRSLLQGFVADWERVQAALLAEVDDLVAEGSLLPLAGGVGSDEDPGLLLASIPALLVAPPACVGAAGLGPVQLGLGLTWLAALVAVVAVGGTLRASFSLAERRSRFASAVTHELRTPLTTFRMYSQMLADDMVPDAARRDEYLRTLEEESARLAQLVENVLSYARLEEGRAHTRAETLAVRHLLTRLRPPLERRLAEAGLELRVDADDALDEQLVTDSTVVGQVLFNLVDNAAKYASRGEPPRVDLSARMTGGRLQLAVRDHGPGIPSEAGRVIFEAFERRGPETTPGVGLGLALARGLARELGGELRLEPVQGPGARFVLELPRGRA